MTYRFIVHDIEWDTDSEKDLGLPTTTEIEVEADSIEEAEDGIADALSDKYGFCVNGCTYDDGKIVDKDTEEKVKAIRETLCKYFECNPWTGKENPNYDPDLSATDAIDQIVEILS